MRRYWRPCFSFQHNPHSRRPLSRPRPARTEAPLSALSVGDTVTIDVTLGSTGGVFGLGVSAIDFDPVVSFSSGTVPANVLNSICVAPGTCFGGLPNTTAAASVGSANVPGLPEVQLFNGVSTVAVDGDGASDQGVITLTEGDPQFRIVFTAAEEGSTTIIIGANSAYGDNVVGAGGSLLNSTNAEITLTVPEPAAMASSLAALGSVLGVVAIRRRA